MARGQPPVSHRARVCVPCSLCRVCVEGWGIDRKGAPVSAAMLSLPVPPRPRAHAHSARGACALIGAGHRTKAPPARDAPPCDSGLPSPRTVFDAEATSFQFCRFNALAWRQLPSRARSTRYGWPAGQPHSQRSTSFPSPAAAPLLLPQRPDSPVAPAPPGGCGGGWGHRCWTWQREGVPEGTQEGAKSVQIHDPPCVAHSRSRGRCRCCTCKPAVRKLVALAHCRRALAQGLPPHVHGMALHCTAL